MAKSKSNVEEVPVEADDKVVFAEFEAPIKDWFSTGCTVLDLAISNSTKGGIPMGRIIEIQGNPSTCKTVLGMTILGATQRKGGIAFFCDVENTFHSEFHAKYGVEISNADTFRLGFWDSEDKLSPQTIEELFDVYIASILELNDERPKVVVIDSLSALTTNVEEADKLGDGTYGTSRAKMMSAALRKYNPIKLSKANTTLIFLNQVRDNISGYGKKQVTSGGKALSFYASTIISLKQGSKICNSKTDAPIGVEIDFAIEKNKAGVPFREGVFRIYFEYGLDNVWSNLNFLKKYGEGSKAQTVRFNDVDKQMHHMVSYVEANGLESKLIEEVGLRWADVHKAPDRKPRVWS